jgi:hypothetical protein
MDSNDSNFRWPDSPPYPPPSWWEVRGTELGLEPDQIKFAAALVTLGGPDSRSNSMAASLAGMDLSRTASFRLARSVKVRKIIDEAEQTRKGERKPLTDDEIDARIDKMIASPNDLAAAKGIELRERRKATRKEELERQDARELTLSDPDFYRNVICSLPTGNFPAMILGSIFRRKGSVTDFPWLREIAPMVQKRFPEDWARWRERADQTGKVVMDTAASGPLLEGDALVAALKGGSKAHPVSNDQGN